MSSLDSSVCKMLARLYISGSIQPEGVEVDQRYPGDYPFLKSAGHLIFLHINTFTEEQKYRIKYEVFARYAIETVTMVCEEGNEDGIITGMISTITAIIDRIRALEAEIVTSCKTPYDQITCSSLRALSKPLPTRN